MSALLTASGRSNERIAISAIHVAFALSILLHAALLSGWMPKIDLRPSEKLGEGKPAGSLAVRLAPPPSPPPLPASVPSSAFIPPSTLQIPRNPARSQAAPRAAPAERVLALERASPAKIAPAAEPLKVTPTSEPPKTASATAVDLAAFIESRRQARSSNSEPPVETEQERHNRLAAINLGLNRAPRTGGERKPGGGIFQIERFDQNDAEFFFYGWNKQIRRNSQQMITVRRGENPSIQLAIVRRMIAIIREQKESDFVWDSQILGRDVWLSARMADNAKLEEFMMQDLFSRARP